MQFRTILPAPQFPFSIKMEDPIMLVGSCFSDNIGHYFATRRFDVSSNPFGVLFNPVSIERAMQFMLEPEKFDKDRYFHKYRDLWVSFAHHGKFSNEIYEDFERNIERQLHDGHEFLQKTKYLFITFGTAYCYKFIPKDLIVSNCHKIPNHQFERTRLDTKQIVSLWKGLISKLTETCPEMKIIFTVSPVRHLSDGAHGNSISKASLILSTEKLVDNTTTFYFPAFEYLMDDLRDYRFYGRDLCHPNDLAVSYLEEKIAESFFDEETFARISEIEKENRFLNHRKFR